MKLVRENINEKFIEKSDPVEDMGIGAIDFEHHYFQIYKNPERKLWKEWKEFIEQFRGKIIVGKFAKYDVGKYEPVLTNAEVKFTDITMNEDGILNLETGEGAGLRREKTGPTYCIIRGEKYKIKDEFIESADK